MIFFHNIEMMSYIENGFTVFRPNISKYFLLVGSVACIFLVLGFLLMNFLKSSSGISIIPCPV